MNASSWATEPSQEELARPGYQHHMQYVVLSEQ